MASRVRVANGPASRAVGLLSRSSMDPEEGLWIVPCAMIHTLFMRFEIDAVFLDRELRAVRVVEKLKPWRLSSWVLGAHSVLELAGGALRSGGDNACRVQIGDVLELR
ncbi:MAG: DUF192 domain-containing protein [Elusimicrobia bacterium]|nr:DUF192 domain-containing protein [Elusimicrobiota bacterium]